MPLNALNNQGMHNEAEKTYVGLKVIYFVWK